MSHNYLQLNLSLVVTKIFLLNGNLGLLSNAFLFFVNILIGIPLYYSDTIFMGRSLTGGFFPRQGAIARCMKLLTVFKVDNNEI